MTNDHQPLRIAIIGGGISGGVLIHALLKHPHLNVHIYEAAPAFKEAGFAISISRQAYQALALIGPSAVDALTKAGAVRQDSVIWMLAEGPDAGQEIDSFNPESEDTFTSIAQRAGILRAFLETVPPERVHVNKKLLKVEQQQDGDGDDDGPVTLHFTDATTDHFDIAIGADGIHSCVRKYILGEDDPAATPKLSPWYNWWIMMPYEKGREILGADLVDREHPRSYFWWGEGTFVVHLISDGGRQVQFIACAMDSALDGAEEVDWSRQVDKEAEKKRFEKWPPNLYRAVTELFDNNPNITPLYLKDHRHARTYIKGSVAIMGDAAHGMTPWQGSGGGTSIEDALILSELLGRARSAQEARVALQVYDETRRPRTQRIVDSSRAIGMLATGQDEEYGLCAEKLRGKVAVRWDHVWFDCEKARDEAVGMMEGRVAKTVRG